MVVWGLAWAVEVCLGLLGTCSVAEPRALHPEKQNQQVSGSSDVHAGFPNSTDIAEVARLGDVGFGDESHSDTSQLWNGSTSLQQV